MDCQRDLFQLPADLVYLNNAYMAPLMKTVEAAGSARMQDQRVPTSFGVEDFFEPPQALRSKFTDLVGGDAPKRIALVPSASYGLSTAAANLSCPPGKRIVLVDKQFPSNVYPWQRLARRDGGEVALVAPPTVDHKGAHWNQAILDAIDTRTAVVAMPHVHWADGTVFDLETIGQKCRSVGAALIIDGTQSVGAFPFDLVRIQPDALICAGYKWLMGSYGLGLAYFGERFDAGLPLEDNWMHRKDSHEFASLVNYQPAYRPGAGRYNMGEASNFTYVAMLNAALDQLLDWGVENIAAYAGRLTSLADEALVPLGFRVEDDAFRAPHLFGVGLPGELDPQSVAAQLKQAGISVSVRGASIRVSAHVYNRQGDLLALRNALSVCATPTN